MLLSMPAPVPPPNDARYPLPTNAHFALLKTEHVLYNGTTVAALDDKCRGQYTSGTIPPSEKRQ